MLKRTTRLLLSFSVAGLACGWGAAAQAAKPRISTLSTHPRVIRYDPEKDEFIHQQSVVAGSSRGRPGGETAYYGSRLSQFRFIGPPGRGGIYDALDEHKARLDLDYKHYQYRW